MPFKSRTSKEYKKLIQVYKYNLEDFIYPVIIFILFVILSLIFFITFKDQNIWNAMKIAGGNAFEFCEFNNLGAALVQRSNTWSNLGFLFVGLLLLFLGIKDVKHKGKNNNLLLKYPIFSIVMGSSILYLFIGSFFYHASLTLFFQMIDQTGMYAIILSFLSYHVFRIWPTLSLKQRGTISSHKIILFLLLFINVLFILFLWKINVNILFPLIFIVYTVLTILYNKKNISATFSSSIFISSLYILLFSFSIWILDRQDVLCDPNSIIQGHALWHILNSVVLLMIYFHYRAEKVVIQ